MNQVAVASEDLRPAETKLKKHQLPPLKYAYTALEPCIDARTMKLHHDVHHGTYVEKLNAALAKFPQFRENSALWLLRHLDKLPEEIRTDVQHNAGGHANHSMFWRAMKPGTANKTGGDPQGPLGEAIKRDFGSFDKFKTCFEEEGAKLFGSGWVWLVRNRQGGDKLRVVTTSGHDHPMMQDRFPILLNDVWEHAYYLHYESRRPEYLKAWWSVVDWEEAARRFDMSHSDAEELWEAEGGNVLPTE